MKAFKTESKIAALLVILFVVSLIPIFWLGCYGYPSADDYGYSAYSHIAWTGTHSIWQTVKGAGATVIERWYSWQGTFSTIFLMALQPGIWGLYGLVPPIMIGMLTLSTLFFLYVVMIKLIHVRPAVYVGVSMLYLIFAVQCMVDKTQGFFWYNGAAHYMLPHSVALFLCGLCILMMTEEKKIALYLVLSCLLAFFVGGSNYVTALIVAVLFVTAFGLLLLGKQKKKCRLLALPFLLFMIAFLLNTLAPGNAVRQDEMLVRPGVVRSILQSFYYCVEYVIDTWCGWPYLLFILALLPFLWEAVKALGGRFSFRAPLFVIAYSYCALSAMFTPSLFATGDVGGGRIFNIIFLDSMLWVMFDLFYCLGWVYRKVGAETFGKPASCFERDAVHWYLAAVLFFGASVGVMYAKVNPDYFTATSAVYLLTSGEASAYGRETAEREAILQEAMDNGEAEIAIPRLTVHPELLFWSDVEEDAGDWKNQSMARYYQKDAIAGVQK
ncbi:MAG: hypothetical protein K2H40_00880 [Lachnospiraceae bacterium]|nr:hypothetical protein [Lachnospiraceae bacterium]